ncbi:psp1 domain-containing protein [Rutstroemia sp. NJR-2017a BBW]|nr:psp1 domain-containing protein [Rutstroemia sp. NJR-2017a BBW]
MSSGNSKAGVTGIKANQSNPTPITSSNPSLLLDKFNGRRSTPDSEALASSDDEGDRQEIHQPAIPPPKPTRRASWLNDTTQSGTQPRKGSFASSSMSPTTSHPSTPSAESSTWGPHSQATSGIAGRGHTSSSSFPWGSGIWNNESRKEPPSRLTEVLPSPTSIHPPGSSGNGYFSSDMNNQRDPSANPTIPFAIPLHPTPKTYRSQSYSVGQLDPDSNAGPPPAGAPAMSGRGRPLQHSGLQHRPSRPSMLSEMSEGLGKVKEVDDDDDGSTNSSTHGAQLQSNEAKTIEILARENAMLRQQQYHNLRLRPRSSTSNAFALSNGYGLQEEPLPEESDYAIDELDELNDLQDPSKGMLGRRMSEFGIGGGQRVPFSLENRKLENVKKAYWQSSLGFGGLGDISQSRRHSFADIPARQGSVSSVGDPLSTLESSAQENLSPKDYQGRYPDGTGYSVNDHASSYFGGVGPGARNPDPFSSAAFQPSAYSYGNINQYTGARPTSPHRSLYGVPQPRHNQLLYIVLFKCSRADVFYVQEGTGLSVKPGDLVIVEADRGTDLGTVARDNVDWATAKELKEHYAEEHYKWLMMYSQGAAGTTDGTGAGLMAAANGMQGSAVGGMGPPSQHAMQEPNPGEIKPKIIKRLAQNHEIQALRDKEGNEAKAKRVCMQKVKEHGLHMEILDAEFQMDWKKLTFYYFADAYINFNSLVTDLFKVYKTRIWMSAINPASFASPSLGLQAPSGIGPGAVGVNRTAPSERRSQQPEPQQSNRGYQGLFAQPYPSTLERGTVAAPSYQPTGYAYGYSPFAPSRNVTATAGGYVPSMIDPYTGFTNSADYQAPGRFPSPHGTTPTHDGGEYGRQGGGLVGSSETWIGAFQGLSMGTR